MKSFTMDPVDDFLKSKLNQPDFKPLTPYEAKIAQKHLEPIVAILLKGCGWEDDFCVLFGTNGKITLYLRMWPHVPSKAIGSISSRRYPKLFNMRLLPRSSGVIGIYLYFGLTKE